MQIQGEDVVLAGESSVQGATDAADNEDEDVLIKVKMVSVKENKVTRKRIILNPSLAPSPINSTSPPQLKISVHSLSTAGTVLS